MKLGQEENLDKNKINNCPICGVNGRTGALCSDHAIMTKNFDMLRKYINEQEKADKRIIYILEFAISDRISYVIDEIPIVSGRIQIEETLKKGKCGKFTERILKEILILQKAKSVVLDMIEI